jgi:hypothetical protein
MGARKTHQHDDCSEGSHGRTTDPRLSGMARDAKC